MPDYETAFEQSALAEGFAGEAEYYAAQARAQVQAADDAKAQNDEQAELAALTAARNLMALALEKATAAKAASEAALEALED